MALRGGAVCREHGAVAGTWNLSPEEQARNDQFLPCCSRALTERLVVEL